VLAEVWVSPFFIPISLARLVSGFRDPLGNCGAKGSLHTAANFAALR
jgi:hypothetical protein